jgi:hypothetical protein
MCFGALLHLVVLHQPLDELWPKVLDPPNESELACVCVCVCVCTPYSSAVLVPDIAVSHT